MGSETRLEEDLFIAAVDWADSIGVDVMTTSLGYRDFDDYVRPFGDLDGRTAPVSKAVNWAFERGIVFTVSASNEGNNPHFPDGGLSSPADAPGALTVGAVDSEGRLAGFSSHGPTADGRTKPDLVARGLSTDMAIDIGENRYGRRSGTSFAAPLIAGAAALILEKYPHWCPADVMQALKQFASLRENPDPYYGWGLPDVYRSIFESVDPGYPEIEMSGRTVLVFPNPVNGRAQFAIRWPLLSGIPRDGARLEVYNILGRLVFEESLAVDMPGQQFLVPWDLRDPAGRVVPSGVYIAIVDGKTPIAAGLLTVVH